MRVKNDTKIDKKIDTKIDKKNKFFFEKKSSRKKIFQNILKFLKFRGMSKIPKNLELSQNLHENPENLTKIQKISRKSWKL